MEYNYDYGKILRITKISADVIDIEGYDGVYCGEE